ncbi:hypothetical protein BGZ83_001502 [Gryganskiella cystojenkinii]|nr:hypothetical protein BGZ83_001502 [Gryganskiella cystojenkinii]
MLPVQNITKPRRHKVVVPSTPSINDPAFPVQIQEELLNQVRYWTSQAEMKEKLNQEYDTKISEQERIIDALQKQRRMREEIDERQKEDQWNLELMNQELRSQNTELQQQLSRALYENTKIQKALVTASEQVEQLKDKEERTAGQLEITKSRHEQDMTAMRKHVAQIQREKSDLSKRVEELSSSLLIQQQKLAKKATMEAIALAQEEEELEAESPVEAPVLIMAPARLPHAEDNHNSSTSLDPKLTSLARETSFAHQQSIISELQSKLGQEVTEKEGLMTIKESLLAEKEELVKMLADREETIETLRLEGSLPVSKQSGSSQVRPSSRRVSEAGFLDPGFAFGGSTFSGSTFSPEEQEETASAASSEPESPVHSGGLFAELAQANSSVELTKPVLEYRDQEVMTDPIESWIHTIPGLVPVAKLEETFKVESISVATNTQAPASVDSSTNTNTTSSVDISTNTTVAVSVDTATNTLTKVSFDNATSTEDDMLSMPVEFLLQTDKTKRGSLLTDIFTGRFNSGIRTESTPDSINATTPTITGLEVASVRLPEVSGQTETTQAKTHLPVLIASYPTIDESTSLKHGELAKDQQTEQEVNLREPVPRRFAQSDIPLDDERRHTCDMSQSISNSSAHFIPPVPALPKSVDGSRVSLGFAFGETSIGLSRLPKSVEQSQSAHVLAPSPSFERSEMFAGDKEELESDYLQLQQGSAKSTGILSPGRPSTGPPSTLLARAAARASVASELDSVFSNEAIEVPATHTAGTITGLAYARVDNPPATAYPIRTSSIRSVQRLASSSPPTMGHSFPPQSRSPLATGAAIISSTTRTAYAFNNSSSQVQLSQGQQQQQHITDSSGASIGRRPRYRPSPNGSVSSVSTDYGGQDHPRRLSVSSQYEDGAVGTRSTSATADPTMIQVITQTMIGDYLWKYTRRPMASVISEKRHKRYFWVHPYTKTMYWSLNNPSAEGSREHRAKSALIVAVFQIADENPAADPDLPNLSLLVQTPSRNLKLTAPTRQKHDLWFQSLAYLLSRPSTPGTDVPSDNQTWSEVQATRTSSMGGQGSSNGGNNNEALLTIRDERSVRKKGSFSRFQTMFSRSKENSPVGSPRSATGGQLPFGGMTSSASQPQQQYTTTSSSSFSGMVTSQSVGPPLSGGSGYHQVPPTVVGYPSHMARAQHTVGGHGTVNGGPILSQASSFGTATTTSPKSRTEDVYDYEEDGYVDYDEGQLHSRGRSNHQLDYSNTAVDSPVDHDEDEEEEDGELPEHVRQCCDGKHDIGSLDHRH